jgi:hypothetical protein
MNALRIENGEIVGENKDISQETYDAIIITERVKSLPKRFSIFSTPLAKGSWFEDLYFKNKNNKGEEK